MELSNEVSSEGGNKSAKMQFKSHDNSPSYGMAPAVSKDVRSRAVRFHLKSDVPATIYFNIYLKIGSTTQQYRATIAAAPQVWTEYEIGFSIETIDGVKNFEVVSGVNTRSLLASDMPLIQKVTFGAVYSGDASANLYNFYVDNFEFDNSLSYSTRNVRTID